MTLPLDAVLAMIIHSHPSSMASLLTITNIGQSLDKYAFLTSRACAVHTNATSLISSQRKILTRSITQLILRLFCSVLLLFGLKQACIHVQLVGWQLSCIRNQNARKSAGENWLVEGWLKVKPTNLCYVSTWLPPSQINPRDRIINICLSPVNNLSWM